MSDTLPDVPGKGEPEPAEAVAPPTPVDDRSSGDDHGVGHAPAVQRRDSPGDTSS